VLGVTSSDSGSPNANSPAVVPVSAMPTLAASCRTRSVSLTGDEIRQPILTRPAEAAEPRSVEITAAADALLSIYKFRYISVTAYMGMRVSYRSNARHWCALA
jgi:hypothetical protein